MRAIDFVGPGEVVLVDDAPQPEPADGEVLVKCSHVALCGTNMGPYLFDGRWGAEMPRTPGWLGHENVGTVALSSQPPSNSSFPQQRLNWGRFNKGQDTPPLADCRFQQG